MLSPFIFHPLASISPKAADSARAAAESARLAAEAAGQREAAKLAERASLHVRDCDGVPRLYATRALELEAEAQLAAAEKSASQELQAEAAAAFELENRAYVQSADAPTRKAIAAAAEKAAAKALAFAKEFGQDLDAITALVSTAEGIRSFLRSAGEEYARPEPDSLAQVLTSLTDGQAPLAAAGAIVEWLAPERVAQRKAERAEGVARRAREARDRALCGLEGHEAQDRAREEFKAGLAAMQGAREAAAQTRFIVDQSEVARREVDEVRQAAAMRDAKPGAVGCVVEPD